MHQQSQMSTIKAELWAEFDELWPSASAEIKKEKHNNYCEYKRYSLMKLHSYIGVT